MRPEGSGLQHAVGELLTCTRCIGGWCALGLVGLRLASPRAGKTVSAVIATAGANNVLQTFFAPAHRARERCGGALFQEVV